MATLTFSDQSRMGYSETVPPAEAGEFIVNDETGVDSEFIIVLHDLSGVEGLTPQLQVFGDATATLMAFIAAGGLREIEHEVASTEAFSERLLALGLKDVSDIALDGGRS